MKLGLLLAAVGMVASCGAGSPLTQDQINTFSVPGYIASSCAQKGWLTNPAYAGRMVTRMNGKLRGRASQAQLQMGQRYAASLGEVQPHHCREIEFEGARILQEDAAKAASSERFSLSMDSVAQSAQQMNANRPRTVSCQHMEWGNTTFCNSF